MLMSLAEAGTVTSLEGMLILYGYCVVPLWLVEKVKSIYLSSTICTSKILSYPLVFDKVVELVVTLQIVPSSLRTMRSFFVAVAIVCFGRPLVSSIGAFGKTATSIPRTPFSPTSEADST